MDNQTNTLREQALALPEDDRAALIADLLSSLDPPEPEGEGSSAQWRDELARRALDDESAFEDWDTVENQVRQQLIQ